LGTPSVGACPLTWGWLRSQGWRIGGTQRGCCSTPGQVWQPVPRHPWIPGANQRLLASRLRGRFAGDGVAVRNFGGGWRGKAHSLHQAHRCGRAARNRRRPADDFFSGRKGHPGPETAIPVLAGCPAKASTWPGGPLAVQTRQGRSPCSSVWAENSEHRFAQAA